MKNPNPELKREEDEHIVDYTMRSTNFKPQSDYFLLNERYLSSIEKKHEHLMNLKQTFMSKR